MRPACGSRPPLFRRLAGLLLCIAVAGCGPSDPLEAARRQQAAGDFAGSLEPLRELLAERPGDAEVLYLYGQALALTQQWSLAEWSLREAMKDPDWLAPAGLQLANGALRTQNFVLAIETTSRVLEAQPDNVDARLMRASAYAHSRLHPEEALEEVERIFELDPANIDAMEPKILALLALERAEEAGEAIAELGRRIEEAELESGMPGWHCTTAALFAMESGEAELAEERFADCVERFPTHGNVVSKAVEFYDMRGEGARALEILERAQQEQPDSRDYRVILTERLRAAGRADEAYALLLEATETENPQLAAAAWLDLVKHHQEVEDYAAAAEAAGRALELARQTGYVHPQLLFEYADALLIAGQYEGALEVVEEMTVSAHQAMIRARVAQERGQPERALAYFDEAFTLWPDNPWARYYAALAAESIGDFDRAIEAYRYSIRISPGATDARLRAARVHAAEGRPRDAMHLLRIKADSDPLSLEGQLLSVQLMAWAGREGVVTRVLDGFHRALPDELGNAAARAAEGIAERAGPEAGIRLLRSPGTEGFDLADPRHVDALRALVRLSHDAGKDAEGEAEARRAIQAAPGFSPFHEVLGRSLELAGGRTDEARKAYARAVELDAGNTRALTGLGRLALADDPAQALSWFERALETRPDDPRALEGAAEALAASGQPKQAEARLEQLLASRPLEGKAAGRLAELQLARGLASDATLSLAGRAARFGGGAEAQDLLSRVHRQRDEPELAAQAADRAQRLRESALAPEGADARPLDSPDRADGFEPVGTSEEKSSS